MLELLLFSFWWFLPAGFANMAPIVAAKIPLLKGWSTPLDFGRVWRGNRITGDNKTWRGLIIGVLVGSMVAYLQSLTPWWHIEGNPFLLGALLGFGALLGDAIESCVKRQKGIASGEKWVPWDQLDYIIGGILCSMFVVVLPWSVYFFTIVFYSLLHPLSSKLGFMLGIKAKPY